MAAPEPMLSVSARRWPDGDRWVLQPKWDGFRLLLEIARDGRTRAWSRHGTDLTSRLGSLLAPFTGVARGTTFDGELVAVSECDGKPIQDFAAVTRGVFTGKPAAMDRLRFVAFDLLAGGGDDVRALPWEERDALLRETLPVCDRIRLADSQPATLAAHDAIVALGFEGTVLKRLGSAYRPGRHRTWIKRKARFVACAELRSVHQDREGRWHALCEADGRRVHALASARTAERIGELVDLVYSRVDADGSLREARVAPRITDGRHA
jgi:bifunctional non-homologous end joining protein LigD